MNRAKYAVLGLRTLEKYPNYFAKLSEIDYAIAWELKLCEPSEVKDISRETKHRAMKDLVELGLVELDGKMYKLKERFSRT